MNYGSNTKSQFQGRIKIFADGASFESLINLSKNSSIIGFTTNPSLMKQSGVTDYKSFSLSLLKLIKDKPISFEVIADDLIEIEAQAQIISAWGENVYVKIPITNSKGQSTLEIIRALSRLGIKINVTAVFTIEQIRGSVSALSGGSPSIISVFAGRIADTGRDPCTIMKEASKICRTSATKIELLWASTRELYNVIQAEYCDCDIITLTPDLIKKLALINKDLTEFSLETVQMFKADAEAAGFSI